MSQLRVLLAMHVFLKRLGLELRHHALPGTIVLEVIRQPLLRQPNAQLATIVFRTLHHQLLANQAHMLILLELRLQAARRALLASTVVPTDWTLLPAIALQDTTVQEVNQAANLQSTFALSDHSV
jgi:hypothetical protein